MNLFQHPSLPGLDEHLARVESALRESVGSEDPLLADIAGHLIEAGGKRLRPTLTLMSALAVGAEVSDDLILGAVSVELVHLGSLYHDDVIDEAPTRRGVESVNARWGNLVAIVAGDFLLARASEIAASLGTEVSGLLARTIGRLCEGEVSEIRFAYNAARPESAYLAAIAGKTASLMSTSCRVGGITTNAPRDQIEALSDFGQSFGMAFQIWDDIMDVIGIETALGKPAGHDLVEGVYTLPVIRALSAPSIGEELAALLGTRLDNPTRDKARDMIRASDALVEATSVARGYADEAAKALAPLGDSPCARSLAGLGHRMLDSLEFG
ncbi:MAG TPA: polyprenyl synthetase family protein [Acidimicrobiales bacterium]|jgi:heptaprenyl diphosphate synthase|nr:polyprenyl synthetase family protein [Acidimicrobiales bacterium]